MYLIIEVINREITVNKTDTLIEAQRYLKKAITVKLLENKHIDVHVDDAFMNAWLTQRNCNYDWKIVNIDNLRDIKDIEVFLK